MTGITVGNLHTYDDLQLILSSKEIGSPEVKTRKIEIEGADSALDLTSFFGEPKFEDVTHTFTFSTIVPKAQFLTWFSVVKNALHGKKQRIILDDDPSFYYWGRCFVSNFTNEKNIGQIRIVFECDPYKYKLLPTTVTQTVSGSGTVTLTNGRKRAVPTINTTASMTIGFNGNSFSRSAGTFTIPEIELVEGRNTITVTGTGRITFTWQEGEL